MLLGEEVPNKYCRRREGVPVLSFLPSASYANVLHGFVPGCLFECHAVRESCGGRGSWAFAGGSGI
eukprot:274734-Pyramimonas_sp.AAC.1